jgi:prolipoprotein diacylglyceryltransferase
VCLVSAVITLSFWIIPAVALLAGGDISVMWYGWIVVAGALISTVFISVTKKEWQEISDSVDGKVSYGG